MGWMDGLKNRFFCFKNNQEMIIKVFNGHSVVSLMYSSKNVRQEIFISDLFLFLITVNNNKPISK